MLNLLLAIACSTAVSSVLRCSEDKISSPFGLLVMNYLACSLCAFAFCGSFQADAVSFGCGIVMGLLLVVSLLLLQYNLSHNGVVLSSLFSRLGVGVPILLSILLFHEMPSMLQWIGICLAAAAIIFLNRKKEEQLSFHFSLLLLLLCNGTCDAMNKIYDVFGQAQLNSQFLFIAFVCALLLAVVLMIHRRERIGKKEAMFGLLVGVPNYFSSRFLLYALKDVPAVIAYPTYSVTTIVLLSLIGVFIYHEKITKSLGIGMAAIVTAIALLNL